MQILLHTDTHTDGSDPMAVHLSTVVNHAMGRFGDRVSRVEAHLSDANSEAKTGPDGIHCTLEARLPGLETVVVKGHAENAHQAIEGALRKLKRAVGAEIARHDPRGQSARSGAVVEAASADEAA